MKKNLKKSFSDPFLLVQCIMFVMVLCFGILMLFDDRFKIATELLMGVTLLVLAFNNYRVYKSKYMTPLYLIFSLLLFGDVIWSLLWT